MKWWRKNRELILALSPRTHDFLVKEAEAIGISFEEVVGLILNKRYFEDLEG